jgi:uncharacterized protein (TIGR00255 family)
LRSMTGFGSASVAHGGRTLRAEARAVNHRFLQLKLRLPGEHGFLEPEIEKRVRARVERGSLSISVNSSGSGGLRVPHVDFEAAARYREQLERLARESGLSAQIELSFLAGLPGVLGGDVDAGELEKEGRVVLEVVDLAIDALEEMRRREGQAMARDLLRSSAAIADLASRIKQRMPQSVAEHLAALKLRVAELLEGRPAPSDADLARELALMADRSDVSEELARLESHIEQLAVLLARDGPVGRQLDFLVQEFLREANTIGSKCSDAAMAHMVVELKTWIERLREQVQNIE